MSIGETLAEARRARGLSTQDVAETTRIRRTVIESIERDDYSICGGDVYARGHIRSIAKVVGVDAEPLLADFVAEHDDDAPSARAVLVSPKGDRPERRGPNWTAAMAAVLVGVVAFGIFQATRGGDDDGGDLTADQSTVSPEVPPTESAAPQPAPEPTPTPSPTLVAEVPAGSA